MSVSITQGDYIYYTDTSLGTISQWSWNFPGGTPTGSTGQNPTVRYLSSNVSGYGASLTIYDPPLSSTSTQNNIITVNPENLSVTLTASPSTTYMSGNILYTATGPTANVNYYTWSYTVGSATGTSNSINPSVGDDWSIIAGTELGAPYSTVTRSSSVLLTSNIGNTNTASRNIIYVKSGPPSSNNLLIYNPYYSLEAAVVSGVITSGIGMNGYGLVIGITGGIEVDNSTFRAQGENLSYWSACLDVQYGGKIGYITGSHVASLLAFVNLGVPDTGWASLTRYTAGNYMATGDISYYFSNKFYFADTTNQLENLTLDPRQFTYSQIEDFFESLSFAYQTSKSLEMDPTQFPAAYKINSLYALPMDGYSGASGGIGGCCIPSKNITGTPPEIYLDVYYSNDNTQAGINPIPVTVTATFTSPGNSPDGYLFLAQDTGAGNGIASTLNTALTGVTGPDNVNPMSSFIEVTASPQNAWFFGGVGPYDAYVFNGLKVSIIDNNPSGPNYLYKVVLRSNYLSWNPPYGSYEIVGDGVSGSSNWLCFYSDTISNPKCKSDPTSIPFRGFVYGS
jgi:hypothetical protein